MERKVRALCAWWHGLGTMAKIRTFASHPVAMSLLLAVMKAQEDEDRAKFGSVMYKDPSLREEYDIDGVKYRRGSFYIRRKQSVTSVLVKASNV